jgi:hypothetical protein
VSYAARRVRLMLARPGCDIGLQPRALGVGWCRSDTGAPAVITDRIVPSHWINAIQTRPSHQVCRPPGSATARRHSRPASNLRVLQVNLEPSATMRRTRVSAGIEFMVVCMPTWGCAAYPVRFHGDLRSMRSLRVSGRKRSCSPESRRAIPCRSGWVPTSVTGDTATWLEPNRRIRNRVTTGGARDACVHHPPSTAKHLIRRATIKFTRPLCPEIYRTPATTIQFGRLRRC